MTASQSLNLIKRVLCIHVYVPAFCSSCIGLLLWLIIIPLFNVLHCALRFGYKANSLTEDISGCRKDTDSSGLRSQCAVNTIRKLQIPRFDVLNSVLLKSKEGLRCSKNLNKVRFKDAPVSLLFKYMQFYGSLLLLSLKELKTSVMSIL